MKKAPAIAKPIQIQLDPEIAEREILGIITSAVSWKPFDTQKRLLAGKVESYLRAHAVQPAKA